MKKLYKVHTTLLWLAMPFMLFSLEKAHSQVRDKYRSYDGKYNNLANPIWGAAKIPYFREIPADYSDGKNGMNGTNRPSPRAISNVLSDEPEDIHNRRHLSGSFYSWGQFIDHDFAQAQSGTEKVPIPLPSDEYRFSQPISFTRSGVASGSGFYTPREQQNNNTSWIDGSHIYGNDKATADWLRTFNKGKLWVSSGNLLPYNTTNREKSGTLDPSAPKMDDDQGRTKKTFAAGDKRAVEHPGLTSLHTLFVREHNRICDQIFSQNSYLSDEEIYQKARKEVGALIQSITYGQWLGAIGVNLSQYYGYNPNVQPDVMNTFATAAYRWHTMVENDVIFRDNQGRGVGPVELPLKDVFFNISIIEKYDISMILKGFSMHRAYETDLKVNNGLRNFLFGTLGTDLVAINLQRGRDHGLPNYNAVRQFYTGSKANSFNDITPDGSIAGKLKLLYGTVDNIDLWAGLFAEWHLTGKSVGKTIDAMMRTQFEKLRDGDYYFYLNDPELASDKYRIQNTTLAQIIERNSSARNFQENIFIRKQARSNGDDIAHYSCEETPQYDGWSLIGRTGSKIFYRWNGGNTTYNDAKELCSRIGGNPLKIENETENNYLKSILPSGSTAWMDMSKNPENKWQYSGIFDLNDALIPGSYPSFFKWRPGEPNNWGGIESTAQFSNDGFWNDIAPTSSNLVIAEISCDNTPELETCMIASYYNNITLSGSPALVRSETEINFKWGSESPAISVINNDGFSARYEGSMKVPVTGNYKFSVTCDDGIRVWINNQLIINQWYSRSSGTLTASVSLTKDSNVPIKIEYFDGVLDSELKFEWSLPELYPNDLPISNLKASYYNNVTLSGTPKVVRNESEINLNLGWFGSPAFGVNIDNFSARYEGNIDVPVSGMYDFTLTSDDGVRLWIGNKLLVDQWNVHTSRTDKVSIFLEKGANTPIKIEYFENTFSAVLKCTYKLVTPVSENMKFKGCSLPYPIPASFSSDECYSISSRETGKVLEVSNSSTGGGIVPNDWNGSKNQIWRLNSADENYFRITNANSNQVMDVYGSSNLNGAKIVQWSWNNGDNQKWLISKNTDNMHIIKSKKTGKTVDLAGSTNLVQYENNNGYNQQWVISLVGCPNSLPYISSVLPNQFVDINAKMMQDNAVIDLTSNLSGVDSFEFQKLNPITQQFEKISNSANLVGEGEFLKAKIYDDKPNEGQNQYRAVLNLGDGNQKISEVINLDFAPKVVPMIFPNPVANDLNVDLENYKSSPVTLQLIDNSGRIVISKKSEGMKSVVSLDVSNLSEGEYLILVSSIGKVDFKKHIVIQH